LGQSRILSPIGGVSSLELDDKDEERFDVPGTDSEKDQITLILFPLCSIQQ
jgi:hypothetical protein